MIVAKIEVSGVRVNMVYRDVVPAGIIGAEIEISYTDDIWRDLRKTVVFRGAVTKDVVTDESIVTIPPEVVEAPNTALSVGVYGVDANGKLAVPTLWADLGYIRPATDPSGDTTTAPSLPVWAQIKQIADDAKQQALSVRTDADSGAFDGKPGPQGLTGDKGEKGDPGPVGPAGADGKDGAPGTDGKTPEYGVDYGTPEQISGIAQQAAEILQPDIEKIKDDISNLRFGDPYDGVDLVAKFAGEISGYTDPWAWIQARIRAGDFTGIHVNDYIPFTTTNNVALKACVGGINTYKGFGDTGVGNHIDFICRELWPTPKSVNPINYNNGLIPVETITSDGITTEFTLTKEMTAISSVKQGSTALTNYSYDASTFKLTFTDAPISGAITVTGTGTEHPWMASDLYLFLNSLAGQIPNSTGLNPAVKHVDYTQGGVYYYLPTALKNVIVEKRILLPKRYSASGLLSDDNSWGWDNIGKLWLPTEAEVYGIPVWGGKGGYAVGGSAVQYPIFIGNMNRLKHRNGGRYSWWVLSVYSGKTTHWCIISSYGSADDTHASNTTIAAPVCFRIS